MKAFQYSRWDGTQAPFTLKKAEVIDTFMENIMKGMSPNMSLAQMLWEGFTLAGLEFRVMGLDEMIAELAKRKDELFSTYNLDHIFDKPIEALKFLLENEAFKRRLERLPPLPAFEELPAGLLEKMRLLANFDLADDESRNLLAAWQRRRKDIFDLYEFYSQYNQRFTGDQQLDFDEAVWLMRQLENLEKLQQQLIAGELEKIDPEQLLRHLGENAKQSFNILLQLPRMVTEDGMVKKKGWSVAMTPKGLRVLGESAFGKLFHHIKKDRSGIHSGNAPQSGEILPDSSKCYQYGDCLDLDITKTILKSVAQCGCASKTLNLDPEEFYVREREQLVTTTTVVLLDLSWSMSLDGRFEAAKKVALALNHYIRTRFPKDRIHVVGFSTEAVELKGDDLATAAWDTRQPFTNLQGGLQLAMQLIQRSGNRNNRVMIITDGQPTAYYVDGKLHVELPDNVFGLSPNAVKATLAEVRRVTAKGMNIETFMLDDNPVLIEFTHEIARINKGRAVLCVPGKLGELILVEEIKRRGGKI